jgi:hypothetical protein
VIGQASFKDVGPHRNAGAFNIVADGFNLPTAALLDGSSLWVADTENNRVVRWDNALTGAAPTGFLGQPNGTTVTNPNYKFEATVYHGTATDPPPTTGTSFLRPRGLAKAAGKLFVSEIDSNRIHVVDMQSFQSVAYLGQPADTGSQPNQGGVTAAGLAEPMGLGADGTNLWVADSRNHRVLGYTIATIATGASASLVVGQGSMQINGFNASSLASGGATAQPRGLAASGDAVWVADSNNHRVLVLKGSDPNAAPVQILGQPNDTLALPNSGGPPSAHTMNGPRGVSLDDQHVIVADTGNHRVLVFSKTGGADAIAVIGQNDFGSVLPNAGGTPSPTSLREPSSTCTDGTRFAIADTGNNRVLVWKSFPQPSQSPDAILGQPDATSVLGNRGGAPGADTLAVPMGCAWLGDALLVADTGNNRVLRWNHVPQGGGQPADVILGQPNEKSRSPASSVFDLEHLAGPAALAFDGTNLYVVDRDLARTIVYGGASLEGGKATDSLGGEGGPSLLRSSGGIAAVRGPLFTTKLYVSDTSSDRVVVVTPYSRLLP